MNPIKPKPPYGLPTALIIVSVLWIPAAAQTQSDLPAGAYVGKSIPENDELGWIFEATFHDPEGLHGSMTLHWVGAGPDMWGLFPNAASISPFAGPMEKTGPDTWAYSLTGYGLGGDGNVVYIVSQNGTTVYSAGRETGEGEDYFSIFLPNQDINPKDGLPDEDEEPFVTFFNRPLHKRLSVRDPFPPKMPAALPPQPGDVWVTDDAQSHENLSGGADGDGEADRALAVRWYVGETGIATYHIYVSVDGGPFEYLVHTGTGAANHWEWNADGTRFINPAFADGPQFGHSYAFRIYAVAASGEPPFHGPYTAAGPVQFNRSAADGNASLIGRLIDEIFVNHNLDYFDSALSPDFESSMGVAGPEGAKAYFGSVLAAFPDLTYTLDDLVVSGSYAAIRGTFRGTQNGTFELGGITVPPSGNPVEFTSIIIYEIHDGLIVSESAQLDILGILEQVGAMPGTREDYGWTPESSITGPAGTPEENLALVQREVDELWNGGDVSVYDELVADEAVIHRPGSPGVTDKAGLIAWANGAFEAYPDESLEATALFASGDKVVLGWIWSASMNGIERPIHQPGITIYRFAGGQIADLWWIGDDFGTGAQLTAPLNAEEIVTITENTVGAVNARDLDALGMLLSPDLIYDFVPFTPPREGPEAFIAEMENLFQATPDYTETPSNIITSVGEQLSVIQNVVTGTHLGEWEGIPPTGNALTITPLQIFKFEGNHIAEMTVYTNYMVGLVQLGLFPMPELPGLAPSFEPPPPNPPEGLTPLETVRLASDLWNARDLAGYAELFSEDMVLGPSLTGAEHGRDEYIGAMELFYRMSSDMQLEIMKLTGLDGGWVLSEVVFRGLHDGMYFDIPPTGNTFDVRGAVLYHFNGDGLIDRFETYRDEVTLLTQVGVLPRLGTSPMAEEQMLSWLNAAYERFNEHDLDGWLEFFADGFVYDNVAMGVLTGKEEFKAEFETIFAGMPDFTTFRDRVIPEGNLIVAESHLTGTHEGELHGVPATGNPVELDYLVIFELMGDKCFRVREFIDLSTMLTQIGALPPSEPPELVPSLPPADPAPSDLTAMDMWDLLEAMVDPASIAAGAALFAEDADIRFGPIPMPLTRGQFMALIEAMMAAFPDMATQTPFKRYLDDGWAVAERAFTATHTGPYMGIPPTGNAIDMRAGVLLHVNEDGLIDVFRFYMDNLTLMSQLGLM